MAKKAWIGITVALMTCGVFAAWSQDKEKAPAAGQAAAEEKKPHRLRIDYASTFHNASTETTDFKDAIVTDLDEGTIINAEKLQARGKKGIETADASGKLSVVDKQADVTGDKATIYFAKSKRLVVLTGNVTILVKPKSEQKDPTAKSGPMPVSFQNGTAKVDDPKADQNDASVSDSRKYPTTITCDKVEYEYAKSKKHAVLTGSFKAVQKLADHTRTLFADHAEYFGLEDRVLLLAPVRWEDTKNNQKGETAENVTVYTKEGDERIEMGKGSITLDAEEEEEGKPAGDKSGTKPPAKPEDAAAKKTETPKPGPDKKALH